MTIRSIMTGLIGSAVVFATVANAATISVDTNTTYQTTNNVDGSNETVTWYKGTVTSQDAQGQAALGVVEDANYTYGRQYHIYDPNNPEGQSMNGQTLDFWLNTPTGFDPLNPDGQKRPLVVFLHGAGSRYDETGVFGREPLKYWSRSDIQALAGDSGAFVMAPVVENSGKRWVEVGPGKSYWDVPSYSADEYMVSAKLRLALTAVAGVVNNAAAGFETMIDTSRIYIVGHSMGGAGAWDSIARVNNGTATTMSELEQWLADEYADSGNLWDSFKFAGGMPVAGAGPNDRAEALASLAVWAMMHRDDTIFPNGAENAIAEIEQYLGDLSAFFETDDVVKNGADTQAISQALATLLAEKRLFTAFDGEVPDGYVGDKHSWISNNWHLASNYIAEWLFAQQMPEPGSLILLSLGAGTLLLRKKRSHA